MGVRSIEVRPAVEVPTLSVEVEPSEVGFLFQNEPEGNPQCSVHSTHSRGLGKTHRTNEVEWAQHSNRQYVNCPAFIRPCEGLAL